MARNGPGGAVSALREEPLRRVAMSFEDYLDLPDGVRAEWVRGEAVIMNAPVLVPHGDAVGRLAALLISHFPDHWVVPEVFLALPGERVRAPDLMLLADAPPDGWVRTPPLLCVEVISPSTRSEDTIRKSMDYAEGGVGQYWIVDPELRTLEAMRLVDGSWRVLAQLDEDHPTAEVELADVTVPLVLGEIIRR